jgi:hypothetical protein
MNPQLKSVFEKGLHHRSTHHRHAFWRFRLGVDCISVRSEPSRASRDRLPKLSVGKRRNAIAAARASGLFGIVCAVAAQRSNAPGLTVWVSKVCVPDKIEQTLALFLQPARIPADSSSPSALPTSVRGVPGCAGFDRNHLESSGGRSRRSGRHLVRLTPIGRRTRGADHDGPYPCGYRGYSGCVIPDGALLRHDVLDFFSIVPPHCAPRRTKIVRGRVRIGDTGVQRQARNGRQAVGRDWLRDRRSPGGIEREKREGLALCSCLTGPIRHQHRERRKENRDRRKFGPTVWPSGVRGEK